MPRLTRNGSASATRIEGVPQSGSKNRWLLASFRFRCWAVWRGRGLCWLRRGNWLPCEEALGERQQAFGDKALVGGDELELQIGIAEDALQVGIGELGGLHLRQLGLEREDVFFLARLIRELADLGVQLTQASD